MAALDIPSQDPRPLDDAARPFADAIAAKYAVKRLIGRGGMGVVFLARDRRLDRLVAIKTLPPQLAADASVRERFFRETRAAGAMSHPNIVPIHGSDEIDGHVFSVMAFIDGESLAAHIRAHGRLDPRVVLGVLRDVAGALSHAHGRGVIHRDIKAENILVDRESGRALVTDFGIARLAEAGPLTTTGQLLGTVYYVSPEQVSGDKVDARSDLYALGVVGFLALTGTFPFDGDLASAVLVAHVTKRAPLVRAVNPQVPGALATIVDRCLFKDPNARYANADDLLTALGKVDFGWVKSDARPSGRPRLVTETEANAIWGRAAALQSSTAEQQRPAGIPAPRDETKDAAVTSGYSVDNVRDSAREAGLSTGVIDRAMAEAGLAAARPGATRGSAVDDQHFSVTRDPFLRVIYERSVDGEVSLADSDRLVGLLRDAVGQEGTVTWFPPALLWKARTWQLSIEASVVPASGQTMVRLSVGLASYDITALILAIVAGFFTFVVGARIAFGGFQVNALGVLLSLFGALITGGAVLLLSLGAVRRRAIGQIRVLAEAIVGNVLQSIHGR